MSAVQAMVSERFIDAMGPMIEQEECVEQVLNYIRYIRMHPSDITEVSEEEFSRLIPLKTAMEDLRLRATNYYQQLHA